MAHPKRRIETSFVFFDVLYVDGTRTSNRRVPATALTGLDGDAPAKEIIEAQDQEIGRASGRPRPAIKSVARSPVKVTVDKA
ncbi:hypothetical protein [Limobrevibacterium gyesilva]|uniref:Uncharacterized protein n=1 Tax=Limobrevibacterium gyesilva TaxID=2991712 RepID=A0AA42CGV7_9PROT|nr:hypothetical protein [Limobrevibacterium gyesilva]MCW3474230.1 hypothetical protein [Limobrevibacterium gyesilva]